MTGTVFEPGLASARLVLLTSWDAIDSNFQVKVSMM
jgi:hypothetical protein